MTALLSVDHLTFRYQDAPREAVKDFALEVGEGEILLLAGQSGCGKSTLLRCVNGLIPHMYAGEYQGDVKVDGLSVRGAQMKDLAQKVGFLFQNPENQIFMFSVERDVAFGLENLGVPRGEMRRRVDEALELLGISDLAGRAPHELSDGQKQRVALAGVLAMRPRLVILDEPTSLLDPMTASDLVARVDGLRRETGATFLIVEHRLDLLLKVADRLVVMNEGRKVMDGPPSAVLSSTEAEGYGVAIPPMTKLQNGLRGEGFDLASNLLSSKELAEWVNVKPR